MAFRRRKHADPPPLDKLLDGYHASMPPSSPAAGIVGVRCWNCQKPNVHDARRDPPVRCGWCRAVL